MATLRFAIFALVFCMCAPGPAEAAYSSEVTLHASGFFEPVSAGGDDTGSVFSSDAGTIVGDEYWRGLYAEAAALAADGELSLGLFGSVWTGAVSSQNGAGGGTSITWDTFTIGPGTSGLGVGEPAQIVVQVRLDGEVELSGAPNSNSSMELKLWVAGTPQLHYLTGNLFPPLDLVLHEAWEFVVETTVGAAPSVNTDLRSWLGGSGFAAGSVGRNFADFDVLVRVIAAPGFEGIAIVSEAGAPTTPIPTADDFDGDGVVDSLDNCIGAANAAQQDTDGDSIGNACDPDIAVPADCFVNFSDLIRLRDAFFSEPGNPGWNADADFTSDGRVNFADLQVMKDHFLDAPGISGLANGCMPVLLASGEFTLHSGMAFDLDTGTETAVGDPVADVAWSVVSPPHDVFFAPQNGAGIDDYGSAEPDANECTLAEPSADPVPFAVTGIGTHLCVRTNQGRIARFQVIDAQSILLPVATTMSIAFVVWD